MNGTKNYRDVLKGALESRMTRNSGYSLRAFARDLKLHPARLSSILSGKKGLSRASASDVAARLGLSQSETEEFLDQVDSLHSRSRLTKSQAAARMKERYTVAPDAYRLTMDAFQFISDWYHLAIVELLKLEGAKSDVKWISRKLEITDFQVEQALERLVRLEVLEQNSDGKYLIVKDFVLSPDGIPSDAIKKAHEQILKKAMDALYLQPVQDRDFYAQIFSISSRDLPEIRSKIRNFSQDLDRTYSTRPGTDRVVCMSSQLINLARMENEESSSSLNVNPLEGEK